MKKHFLFRERSLLEISFFFGGMLELFGWIVYRSFSSPYDILALTIQITATNARARNAAGRTVPLRKISYIVTTRKMSITINSITFALRVPHQMSPMIDGMITRVE
jgi:hypothetical protein